MVGTIQIHGSDGEVMAPIGGGEFITGKWQDILIVAPSKDEDVPLHVRQALVGLIIPTIFSSEQLKGAAPPGSRTAYGSDVAEVLKKAKKGKEAKELLAALERHDPSSEVYFLVFEDGTYELVERRTR